MHSKLSNLLEILDIIEDDKRRMSTFITADTLKQEISDKERNYWYRRASNASNELWQQYFSNRALGYNKSQAYNIARDAIKKERERLAGEDAVGRAGKDGEDIEFGVDTVSGDEHQAATSDADIDRKQSVDKFVQKLKDKYKNDPNALKVWSATMINKGLDKHIPHGSIPYYDEVSKTLKELGTFKKSTLYTVLTDKPPKGMGIPIRTYRKVRDDMEKQAGKLSNESFLESFFSGISSLFGNPGGSSKSFKLSNLEPMIDIIKKDMNNNKASNYGIHLQGVMKEEGEDLFKDLPNIKHQYQGDALVIPILPETNLKQLLKKAIPGKRVILFGFDKKATPIRKGWEGFQYKLAKNPTLIGSYSLAPESKAESLKLMLEGFQCSQYKHADRSCGVGLGECKWQGFPSMVGEDMQQECKEYR